MKYIVLNPAGASGRTIRMWERLKPVFDEYGEYTLCQSTVSDSIGDICRRVTSRGERTELIVIGGDGTFNEAVNGISDLENTLFGFIPCGTGNDIGRDMGLPDDSEELVRIMSDGEMKRTADIGELAVYLDDKIVRRRFNVSSDVGFGAATCAKVQNSPLKPVFNKLGLGRLTYLIEAISVCFSSKPVTVKVTCNGKSTVYKRNLCVVVMNHGYEGGGFRFCPDADYDDGQLDICIGNGLSHIGFLRMLPLAYMGKHLSLKGITAERTDHVVIQASRPLWVHTDGEVLGMVQKASMRVLPEKLKLLI